MHSNCDNDDGNNNNGRATLQSIFAMLSLNVEIGFKSLLANGVTPLFLSHPCPQISLWTEKPFSISQKCKSKALLSEAKQQLSPTRQVKFYCLDLIYYMLMPFGEKKVETTQRNFFLFYNSRNVLCNSIYD